MEFNKVSKLSPEFNLSVPDFFFVTQHSWNCYYIRGQILFLLHLYLLVININAAVACLNVKFKVNSEKIPEGMVTKIKPDLIRDRSNEILYQVEPKSRDNRVWAAIQGFRLAKPLAKQFIISVGG